MNINKQALREAATKAKELGSISRYTKAMVARLEFKEAATPDAMLALLDELEAAEKRIAELAAREVKFPDVEKWRSPEAVRAQNAYRVLVGQELSAAGIITKVGE
ncbi:ead/Ea22-like family protein [Leclercia sp. H6W5]|uniref:ead/Ea22-like family protein n=1 Tax=Leclercia tamurae TaxID=2926467 RepID=UPI0021D1F2F0|nr:ead/Ea22-like family protein [Leclercia tamurae]MCU6682160.1 ead/Ea22-like family protein [Leclercia tamurae]